jgi:dipeptidase E
VTACRIVAMGGGGWSMDGRLLDDHILGLTGKQRPRVCYVPTASGDGPDRIARFHEALGDRAETAVLGLFWREVDDIAGFLCAQDVIYVGGGNTANMLAVWRLHGVDTALRAAWEAGVVLCGLSAGANCWFEACSTDSFGAGLAPLLDGLGFLAGSFCPHYDGEPLRRPTYIHWVAEGGLPPGFAADDGVALCFEGTELTEAISERDGGRAFRVAADGETALEARRLT